MVGMLFWFFVKKPIVPKTFGKIFSSELLLEIQRDFICIARGQRRRGKCSLNSCKQRLASVLSFSFCVLFWVFHFLDSLSRSGQSQGNKALYSLLHLVVSNCFLFSISAVNLDLNPKTKLHSTTQKSRKLENCRTERYS